MKTRKFTVSLFVLLIAALAVVLLPAADSPAAELTTVKIGYLHTLAVDGQFWLGEHYGFWEQHGIKFEPIRFYTGIDLFQALSGGSIDMLITGAVISNWPARGQGKVFLINNIEFGTAQLWVQPDSGINSLKDLKGKKISTTRGTTAHVFLHNALKSVGVPKQGIEIVGATLGAVYNNGAKMNLNKSKTLALEVKDMMGSDRALFFGVKLGW